MTDPMPVRVLIASAFSVLLLMGGAAQAAQPKVLRYALPAAETGFDPVRLDDLYSITLISHVFEAPLAYDYHRREPVLVPNTAQSLPHVSADGKTITVTLRPGVYFADDPAFGGKRRELTAEDHVFSLKRHFDPRAKSPNLNMLAGVLQGMDALHTEALKTGRFDYDRRVPGIEALSRYQFVLRLNHPSATLMHSLAYCPVFCAVAREVVQTYGAALGEHPVGTGPFRLAEWKRASRMVFERQAHYRTPPALDRVEVSVVEEAQPRWLAFLNGEHDFIEALPYEFANVAIPNNELAPHLRNRGIRMERQPRSDLTYAYFAWNDPVVGGPAPAQVALRRAIAHGYDTQEEILILRKGQAIAARGAIAPGVSGYSPNFHAQATDYLPARAKALLDLYGYRDVDGDGYREQPNGQPLTIVFGTGSDQTAKQQNELWKKHMDALGIRLHFKRAKWPEQLKAARAGQWMMWALGQSAQIPDADVWLAALYGPNAGTANLARFDLPAYNQLYERYKKLPEGPERQALIGQMQRLILAYAPWKLGVHRYVTDLSHPWMSGFRRHPVMRQWWQYVDIDPNFNRGAHDE